MPKYFSWMDDVPILGDAKKWLMGEDTTAQQKQAAAEATAALGNLAQDQSARRMAGLKLQQQQMQPFNDYTRMLYGDYGQGMQPQMQMTDEDWYALNAAPTMRK